MSDKSQYVESVDKGDNAVEQDSKDSSKSKSDKSKKDKSKSNKSDKTNGKSGSSENLGGKLKPKENESLKGVGKDKKSSKQKDKKNPQKKGSKKDDADDDEGSKGKEVAKKAAAAAAPIAAKGGAVGAAALGAIMLLEMLLKAIVSAIATMVSAVISMIMNTAIAVIAAVMAVLAMTFPIVAGVIILFVAVVGAITAVTVTDQSVRQARIADEQLPCQTKRLKKTVKNALKDSKVNGEDEARIQENGRKIYSVLDKLGYTKDQIAGVIGAFVAESGVQPRRYESDYIFTDKYDELDDKGPLVDVAAGSWDAFFVPYASTPPSMQPVRQNYKADDGKEYLGVGLGQWTAGRAKGLWEFAKTINQSMFDIDTQLAYMVSTNDSGNSNLLLFKELTKNSNAEESASVFLEKWEGVAGNKESYRREQANKWRVELEKLSPDSGYADSILSQANVKAAAANSKAATLNKSDKCKGKIGDHVEDAEDGTGEFPAGVTGIAWKPDEVPDALKPYIKDPKRLGLTYKGGDWCENSGQCVDLTETVGNLIWGYDIKQVTTGNGVDQASAWASRWGTSVSTKPLKSGSIFSTPGPTSAGHTGIVMHLFANGDIMILEQNYLGYSGANGIGVNNTWNYRYVKKAEIESEHYTFAAPKSGKAKWSK